jgi:hypothetical protein
MNRALIVRSDESQRAAGTSGDTINVEGSGKEERQGGTKSNNSLNPTGVSIALIVELAVA